MRKVLLLVLLASLIIGPVLSSCTTPAPAEVINIRAAVHNSDRSVHYEVLTKMGGMIEEQSGGRVKFEYFSGGTVITTKDAFDSVVNGVVDIAPVLPGFIAGRFPMTNVIDLAPAFLTGKEAAVVSEFFDKHLAPPDEWADAKTLFMFTHGGSQILSAEKPVRTLEDMKGMRIRAVGLAAKVIERMGGIPITLPPPEIYEAMQRGTLDGASIAAFALTDLKLSEVCKYNIELGAYTTTPVMVMNQGKYDSLPKDIQKMFDKLSDVDTIRTLDGEVFDRMQDEARTVLTAAGGETIYLDPAVRAEFLKIAMAIANEWAEEMEAKGYPAKKLLQEKYDYMKPYLPEVFK